MFDLSGRNCVLLNICLPLPISKCQPVHFVLDQGNVNYTLVLLDRRLKMNRLDYGDILINER